VGPEVQFSNRHCEVSTDEIMSAENFNFVFKFAEVEAIQPKIVHF